MLERVCLTPPNRDGETEGEFTDVIDDIELAREDAAEAFCLGVFLVEERPLCEVEAPLGTLRLDDEELCRSVRAVVVFVLDADVDLDCVELMLVIEDELEFIDAVVFVRGFTGFFADDSSRAF